MAARASLSINSRSQTGSSRRVTSSYEIIDSGIDDSQSTVGSEVSTVQSVQRSSAAPADSLTTHASRDIQNQARLSCAYKLPSIRSKGAILALVWNFLFFSGISGAYTVIIQGFMQHVSGFRNTYAWTLTTAEMIRRIAQIVPFPIAGWLADTYFGRYKVIHYSLWIVWLASFPLVAFAAIDYHFNGRNEFINIVINYVVYPAAFVALTVGIAGFQTNIIPFGTDQMPGASGQELVAFIHWYYWTEYVGFGIVYTFVLGCNVHTEDIKTKLLVLSLVQAGCLTAAISLDFVFHNWLAVEPAAGNPLKTTVGILKFARTNKFPRQRSALTYWEEEIPTGIDLAKRRYGGPFTTEEVEDVKSFCRIVLVIASWTISWAVIAGLNGTTAQITNHLRKGNDVLKTSGQNCYETAIVDNLVIIVVIVIVPVYHFLVQPIFYNCIPKMLRKIAIGMFLLIPAALCPLLVDIKGHLCTNETVPCFLVANASAPDLNIDYRWLAIPNILTGLSLIISGPTVYEFICAQAPNKMKGFLIGLQYSVFGLANAIGFAILLSIHFHYTQISQPPDGVSTCGFLYYILNLILALIGFFLVCIAAKCYKPRQRDDLSFEQAHIEIYFTRDQLRNPRQRSV